MEYLYHGSRISGLNHILPFKGERNAYKDLVSCYSNSYLIALLYIRKYSFHWVAFDYDDNLNIVTFKEYFPKMLEELYQDISGSIYYINKDNPLINSSRFKGMYIATEPIIPNKEQYINDVYYEILNQEKQGRININRYDSISIDEKRQLEEIIYQAIIREKLVINPWEKSQWVKKHFTKVWTRVENDYSKMTHEELLRKIKH